MTLSAEVVIVGGGIMGASLAHHLTHAGLRDIVVIEQGQLPGRGATVRSAGLLRQHHTALCDVELAVRSLAVFEQWADAVGGDCGYRRTGFALVVGPEHAEALKRNVEAVNAAGGSAHVLDVDELVATYPGLSPDGIGAVAYEPKGGFADPARAAGSMLAAARARGARAAEGILATKILTDGESVVGLETNAGDIACRHVVLAGGAWSTRLAAGVGIALPVTPRRIGLAIVRLPEHSPDVPTCIDDTKGVYFRPDGAGRLWFGVSTHPEVDLDGHPDPLAREEIARARAAVMGRIPAIAGASVEGTRTGLDGYTPDRRPVIGPSGPDGLYLCVGFSGGGFKMAPAVGELAASEMLSGCEEALLTPYRAERFEHGSLIEGEYRYAHI